MAKKHKRSRKNTAETKPPIQGESKELLQDSFNASLTPKEFNLTIAILIGCVCYFVWFLFAKTEYGYRYSTYFALVLNSEIYWAYWTGSPSGSVSFSDRVPILLGVSFHLALAYGVGSLLLGLLVKKAMFRMEWRVLAIGIGLATISTYTVLAGVIQLYHLKWLLVIPIVVLAAIGWLKFRQPANFVSAHSEKSAESKHWSHWIALCCGPFFIFTLLASMVPPWEFDVREYHFQVPKEWFKSGGVTFMPHNVYGNMPLGTEMHSLFAMLYSFGKDDWWWGVAIGKTVSGLFAVLNALTIYCVGRRLFGLFAGASAAVIYASTPWVIANSIIGYNEGAVGCYLMLATLAYLIARNGSGESETGEWSTAILLGILIGASIACKYTALPFIGLPAVFVLAFLWWKQMGSRRMLASISWLVLGITLFAGVWFAKNFAFTGNPTYPLLDSVFGATRSELQASQWASAHSSDPPIPSGPELASRLNTLVVSYKWLSPLVFPLVVLSLFNRDRRTVILIGGYLFFVFGLWLLVTHRLERFLLPFFGCACLMAGAGLSWLERKSWRHLASGIVLVGCVLNGLLGTSRLVGDVRIFASLKSLDCRRLSAEDYQHPQGLIVPLQHLSPTIAWLNEKFPDSRVLMFGECRPLTAEFEVIYNTCFDTCETWKRLQGKNPRQIRDQLHSEGITHLLVNPSELERFKSTYGYNVDDGGSPITVPMVVNLEGEVLRKIRPDLPAGEEAGILLFEVR